MRGLKIVFSGGVFKELPVELRIKLFGLSLAF